MQTRLAMSTSHHPQTDGQTERANRTLEEMARHYVNYRQNNWDELLPGIEHAYNSSVHATTGESPFMLTYGKAPRTLSDLVILPSKTSVETVTEFVTRMQDMAVKAKSVIEAANKSAEQYSNKARRDHQFGVGDKVLLSTKYFLPDAFRNRKKKLAAKFAGPYEITKVVSPVAFRIKMPPGTKAHDVFHASMLKPYLGDSTSWRTPPEPIPVIMADGTEEYEVERIISHRKVKGKSEYLVKWLNMPLSESSWENGTNLTHCGSSIRDFHKETGT
jgi:hypothetical protein